MTSRLRPGCGRSALAWQVSRRRSWDGVYETGLLRLDLHPGQVPSDIPKGDPRDERDAISIRESPRDRADETTMTSFRKTALVCGLLYLLTFIGSIGSAVLV